MRVLVTGASRGIGKALCKALLARGHEVRGLSRSLPPGEVALHVRFRHVPCDLSDAVSRREAAERMRKEGFRPDAVVLNAGVEYMEGRERMDWQKAERVLRTNVDGALFWIAETMPWTTPIQFVGISSILAFRPDADCPAYSASKAALSLALRSFRLRFRGTKARFKLLYLGPVHTGINPAFRPDGPLPRGVLPPEEVAEYLVETVLPSRREDFYHPCSVAAACRFGGWLPDSLFERITRPFRRKVPPS